MFFGYNLTLGRRTTKLEKKNGHELEEIKKLKKALTELKAHALSNLPKKETAP